MFGEYVGNKLITYNIQGLDMAKWGINNKKLNACTNWTAFKDSYNSSNSFNVKSPMHCFSSLRWTVLMGIACCRDLRINNHSSQQNHVVISNRYTLFEYFPLPTFRRQNTWFLSVGIWHLVFGWYLPGVQLLLGFNCRSGPINILEKNQCNPHIINPTNRSTQGREIFKRKSKQNYSFMEIHEKYNALD